MFFTPKKWEIIAIFLIFLSVNLTPFSNYLGGGNGHNFDSKKFNGEIFFLFFIFYFLKILEKGKKSA